MAVIMEVHHDEDAQHLNPNEEDCPLFKLHSANPFHNAHTPVDELDWDDVAFVLDYFEHGMFRWFRQGDPTEAYNLDGGGWDTSRSAGVLTIEDREWWDNATPEDRAATADQWLQYYNDWGNGYVYGVEAYRTLPDTVCSEGETHSHREIVFEACWGYVGDDGLADVQKEIQSYIGDGEEIEVVYR